MDVFEAIRGRRTVKAFTDEPVSREILEELFELARWTPNHKLTQPWRFRVLGPQARAALKAAAGEQARVLAPEGSDADKIALIAAAKIDRAPTLVVISSVRNPDPVLDTEDFSASSIAGYLVLLGAHAHGLAGYWRTPSVLRDEHGLKAVGVGGDEEALGLLYLGYPSLANPAAGDRASVDSFASFLD